MSRPKATEFVGFKCPPELKADALFIAHRRGITEGEIWKEAMEYRLSILRVLSLDYYELRPLLSFPQVQPGSTVLQKV